MTNQADSRLPQIEVENVLRENVSQWDLAVILEHVERLNKRLKRAGLPLINHEVESETIYHVERVFSAEAGRMIVINRQEVEPGVRYEPKSTRTQGTVSIEKAYDVAIDFPKVPACKPGHVLSAIIKPAIEGAGVDSTARIITRLPAGEGLDLERYRTCKSFRCAECNAVRRRNSILIILEEATGEHRAYGVDCATHYIPAHVNSVEMLADVRHVCLEAVAGEREDGYPRGWSQEEVLSIESVVRAAAYFIAVERTGYVKTSSEDAVPTRDRVSFVLGPRPKMPQRAYVNYDGQRWDAEQAGIEENDAKLAEISKRTWKFVEDLEGASDYDANVKAAFSAGAVGSRTLGIVASAVGVMIRREQKDEQERREKEAHGESEWVGEVGERRDFGLVTVIGARGYSSQWGGGTIFTFRDASGNVLKLFTSGMPSVDGVDLEDLDGDVKFGLTATVKKHGEWKGVKETTISRATSRTAEAEEKRAEKARKKAERAAKKASAEAEKARAEKGADEGSQEAQDETSEVEAEKEAPEAREARDEAEAKPEKDAAPQVEKPAGEGKAKPRKRAGKRRHEGESVPCPRESCGAGIGERCRNAKSRQTCSVSHSARVKAEMEVRDEPVLCYVPVAPAYHPDHNPLGSLCGRSGEESRGTAIQDYTTCPRCLERLKEEPSQARR